MLIKILSLVANNAKGSKKIKQLPAPSLTWSASSQPEVTTVEIESQGWRGLESSECECRPHSAAQHFCPGLKARQWPSWALLYYARIFASYAEGNILLMSRNHNSIPIQGGYSCRMVPWESTTEGKSHPMWEGFPLQWSPPTQHRKKMVMVRADVLQVLSSMAILELNTETFVYQLVKSYSPSMPCPCSDLGQTMTPCSQRLMLSREKPPGCSWRS